MIRRALLAALLTASACAEPVTMSRPDAGGPLSKADIAFIEPGVTTCEEAVLRLGTPFYAHDAERMLAYAWLEEVVTIHSLAIPIDILFINFESPLSLKEEILTHLCLMTWDEQGVVRSAYFSTVSGAPHGREVEEALKAWAEGH